MTCTNHNHAYFVRHGIPCDCAITSRVVNGIRVDTTLREKQEAEANG